MTVEVLDWCFAYNLFRLAAVVQGIAGRLAASTVASERAAGVQARVPALAEAGGAFALKAGARMSSGPEA